MNGFDKALGQRTSYS